MAAACTHVLGHLSTGLTERPGVPQARSAAGRQSLNAAQQLVYFSVIFGGIAHGALTGTEYRLLSTLADRLDAVVTRKDLAQKVWGYEEPSAGRTIDVHVRRLRAKLATTHVPAPAIVAVRGLGYKLASSTSD
jgi:DNA-binding response OmpR family regulator